MSSCEKPKNVVGAVSSVRRDLREIRNECGGCGATLLHVAGRNAQEMCWLQDVLLLQPRLSEGPLESFRGRTPGRMQGGDGVEEEGEGCSKGEQV